MVKSKIDKFSSLSLFQTLQPPNNILENIREAIFIADTNGRIFSWNQNSQKLFGYSVEEIRGKKLTLIYPPKYTPTLKKDLQEITKNGSLDSFWIGQKKDGCLISINIITSPLKDNQGKTVAFIAISHDISDNQRTEEVHGFLEEASRILAASLDYQTTLETVAKLAVPGIADWCAVDLWEHGTLNRVAIAHVNPSRVRLAKLIQKQYPPDIKNNAGTGKVLATGEPEFYPLITPAMLARVAKDKKHLSLLTKIGMTSLIMVPLLSRNKVIGTITLVNAESRRRFNEEDLETAQQLAIRASAAIENSKLYKTVEDERERLDNLLGKVPGIVWEEWVKPEESNQINFVSQYIETMLGYTPKEWLQTPNFWITLVHPEDKDRVKKEFHEIFYSTSGGVCRCRLVTKNGRVIWVETQASVIKNQKGKPIGIRGVTFDITERMELERRKDEFISTASHELKTPMTTIKGFTQILANLFAENPAANVYLSKMNDQIDRLRKLVDDLLDVSKIQSSKLTLHKQKFNVSELIRETCRDLQYTSTHHQLRVDIKDDVVVNADRYRLYQVLTNVLSNAIKYSPNGKLVLITGKLRGNSYIISIKDFGIGISKKNLTKIFEPFYQAETTIRRSFAGLGLGLHISKDIIEKHGGQIWAESQKGKYSIFTITIPIK